MTTIVIGVDLGNKGAVATIYNGELIRARKTEFRNDTNGEDFAEFEKELGKEIYNNAAQNMHIAVLCESPPFYRKRSVESFRKLAGYEAVFLSFCQHRFESGVIDYYESINNWTIKSHFGCKNKADMMAKAKELSGRDDLTQDEADAILVAFYGWEMIKNES